MAVTCVLFILGVAILLDYWFNPDDWTPGT